ncbi:MAG: hemolysin family protein [Actinobacteria bacterium]|nr:hemolysin family protein [Actinomycetota bacterium]MCA1721834.1 hemolysin family protein [Actinomycetota bacterium]
MTDILVSAGIIALLILFGGVFVASEIALVSLRESQVKALAETGKRGRRVALLASSPNRFLATVQLVVTAAGFMSAAFGESRLSSHLAPALADLGLSEGVADVVSLILITLIISYFAITAGELVPKRLALQRAEKTALLLSPLVDRSARISRPAIWLLSRSTDVLVRLFGGDPGAKREAITEEELRGLVASHESLTKDERKLIDDVFAAGERQLREVMIPRTEVAFLEATTTVSRAQKLTSDAPHSRYPVARDSQDDVAGFVHVRDLMVPAAKARTMKVADVTRDVKLLPGTKKVLPALSEMRREGHHMAIVVDEYGGTAGIVTMEDLIEEVIGDIRDEYDVEGDEALRIAGVDVEADGLLNLDEVFDQTGVRLPEGPYETLAGYVMASLGHVPRLGEAVEVDDHRLTVTELDARRVARVRVDPIEAVEDQQHVEAS